ncbi:uncharacterized protein [Periplaneta americana]|uniref:uncharacterized protein n=1 Tax=Periplaneta americana TaxID=6978 RepID=UPI0037E8E2FE
MALVAIKISEKGRKTLSIILVLINIIQIIFGLSLFVAGLHTTLTVGSLLYFLDRVQFEKIFRTLTMFGFVVMVIYAFGLRVCYICANPALQCHKFAIGLYGGGTGRLTLQPEAYCAYHFYSVNVWLAIAIIVRYLYTASRNSVIIGDPTVSAYGWLFGRGDCLYKSGLTMKELDEMRSQQKALIKRGKGAGKENKKKKKYKDLETYEEDTTNEEQERSKLLKWKKSSRKQNSEDKKFD